MSYLENFRKKFSKRDMFFCFFQSYNELACRTCQENIKFTSRASIPILTNDQSLMKEVFFMKKSRKLFIVTALIMALGFIVPVLQGSTALDAGTVLGYTLPPADTFGLW